MISKERVNIRVSRRSWEILRRGAFNSKQSIILYLDEILRGAKQKNSTGAQSSQSGGKGR